MPLQPLVFTPKQTPSTSSLLPIKYLILSAAFSVIMSGGGRGRLALFFTLLKNLPNRIILLLKPLRLFSETPQAHGTLYLSYGIGTVLHHVFSRAVAHCFPNTVIEIRTCVVTKPSFQAFFRFVRGEGSNDRSSHQTSDVTT